MDNKDFILAIDFGTTNSAAAVMRRHGYIDMIRDETARIESRNYNEKAFPSLIWFSKDLAVTVGREARDKIKNDSEGAVTKIKLKLGIKDSGLISIRDKQKTIPEVLAALIFKKIKKAAEEHLKKDLNGKEIKNAIITVPANWDSQQRKATKAAAKLAGFEIKDEYILNEPEAATIAFATELKKKGKGIENKKILVFDMGGGTLDITAGRFINIPRQKSSSLDIIATKGDKRIGGSKIDERFAEVIIKKLNEHFKTNVNNLMEGREREKFLLIAEDIKIELSEKKKVNIREVVGNVNLKDYKGTPLGIMDVEVSRDELELVARPIVEKAWETLKFVFDRSEEEGIYKEDFAEILLVGGPTKMPLVRGLVEKWTGKEIGESVIDPMECVARGAAIKGASIAGIGIGDDIPVFSKIDGALCTLTVDGPKVIIPDQADYPCEESRNFVTVRDNQDQVRVQVLKSKKRSLTEEEIENLDEEDFEVLDEFILPGLPKKSKAGEVKIKITYEVDAGGKLVATAESVDQKNVKTTRELRDVSLFTDEEERDFKKQVDGFKMVG